MLPMSPVLWGMVEQRQEEVERYVARLQLERIITQRPAPAAEGDDDACLESHASTRRQR